MSQGSFHQRTNLVSQTWSDQHPGAHRATCHRCGNMRKKVYLCPTCPQVFCSKCTEKMIDEHGSNVFCNGCPVCKDLCCCGSDRSKFCRKKYHCYKKCPTTRYAANKLVSEEDRGGSGQHVNSSGDQRSHSTPPFLTRPTGSGSDMTPGSTGIITEDTSLLFVQQRPNDPSNPSPVLPSIRSLFMAARKRDKFNSNGGTGSGMRSTSNRSSKRYMRWRNKPSLVDERSQQSSSEERRDKWRGVMESPSSINTSEGNGNLQNVLTPVVVNHTNAAPVLINHTTPNDRPATTTTATEGSSNIVFTNDTSYRDIDMSSEHNQTDAQSMQSQKQKSKENIGRKLIKKKAKRGGISDQFLDVLRQNMHQKLFQRKTSPSGMLGNSIDEYELEGKGASSKDSNVNQSQSPDRMAASPVRDLTPTPGGDKITGVMGYVNVGLQDETLSSLDHFDQLVETFYRNGDSPVPTPIPTHGGGGGTDSERKEISEHHRTPVEAAATLEFPPFSSRSFTPLHPQKLSTNFFQSAERQILEAKNDCGEAWA